MNKTLTEQESGETDHAYRDRLVSGIQKSVAYVSASPLFEERAAERIDALLTGIDLNSLSASDNTNESLVWLYKEIAAIVLESLPKAVSPPSVTRIGNDQEILSRSQRAATNKTEKNSPKLDYWQSQRREKILAWVLYGILAVVFLVAACILGLGIDAFPRYSATFILLWLAVPVAALSLRSNVLADNFTLTGVKHIQVVLILLVIVGVLIIAGHSDLLKYRFGHTFISGYRQWPAGYDYDSNGDEHKLADNWTASTVVGRAIVYVFWITLKSSYFIVPIVTWLATKSVISKKEREASDGT